MKGFAGLIIEVAVIVSTTPSTISMFLGSVRSLSEGLIFSVRVTGLIADRSVKPLIL